MRDRAALVLSRWSSLDSVDSQVSVYLKWSLFISRRMSVSLVLVSEGLVGMGGRVMVGSEEFSESTPGFFVGCCG